MLHRSRGRAAVRSFAATPARALPKPLTRTATLVAVVLVLAPASADGHAAFLSSRPAPGQRLQGSPSNLTLRFTESLDRRLSTVALFDARSGRRIALNATTVRGEQISTTPSAPLGRGAYRIEWHSVSADDGHALEGSISFGVRAATTGGASQRQQSALAGTGWARVVARALLDAALLVFAAALLLRALLQRGSALPWLLPGRVRELMDAGEVEAISNRHHAIVIDAGVIALSAAALSALLDTANAAGGLAPGRIGDYLLSSSPGAARLALVLFIGLMLLSRELLPRASALTAALALGWIAVGGHASASGHRAEAVLVEWLHLLAASIWLGGVALLVATWLPRLRRADRELRLAVMRHVLPAFGRVALPAFLIVVVTGALNAYFDVGRVAGLWQTAYGRVLLVKIALVGLVAVVSYTHAIRLRPRLLGANPHPPERSERRHWRLLLVEPLVAGAVIGAVALLVAFPQPRPSAASAADISLAAACSPSCPLRLPTAAELAVADQAGSYTVAAWIDGAHGRVVGEVRVFDIHGQPAAAPFEIQGAGSVTISCGVGCRKFTIPRPVPSLRITVEQPGGGYYTATLPAVWRGDGSRRARELLYRAQAVMRALRSVRQREVDQSVPGVAAVTDYRLAAPNRVAYRNYVTRPGTPSVFEGAAVVVGDTQWDREPGTRWRRGAYAGGGLPFRTRTWFTWTPYAQAVRLLATEHRRGRRVAVLALMDPGTPAWTRLAIDLATLRVVASRLVTPGHFNAATYSAFDQPLTIATPTRAAHRRRTS